MKAPHHLLSTIFVLALSFSYASTVSPDWHMELDHRAIETSNVGLGGNNCDTVVYVDMDVCAGSVLTINNQSVSTNGLYTDSLISVGGCDSVVVYKVLFQAHYFYYSSDSICKGDSIMFGNVWRKDPGLYYDTLISVSGCDSVLGISVSYKDSTHIQRQIYKCNKDSVFAGGAWQTTPGIYYDTSYSVTLCDSFIVTEIIDYSNPHLQANASSNMICEGTSLTLSSNGSGTEIWNTGQIGDFICYPTVTSTYKVSEIDSNGCFASDSVTVYVLPKPLLVVDSLINLCDGDSVQLNANASSSVIWNGGLSNGANVSPGQNTNYIATTINSFGCSAMDSTMVVVYANPTLSIPVPFSICKEDSVWLNGISNGNVNWNIGTGNNVMIKPLVSSTYYVTATNAIGCESIDSLEISVLPLPILNINNITPICEGQSTSLFANTNGTLNWNVGFGNNVLVSPSNTTEYFATATDTNGCQRKDSVEVVVYSNPVLTVANTPTICIGDSVNLTAVSNGNVIWNIGGSNPVMVSPSTTTNYFVTATNIYGCTTEDSTTLVVNPLPTLTINPIAPICDGDSTYLIATSSGIVQWNIGIGNTQIVSPSQNTMYYANVTSTLGCEINDSVIVYVLPKPLLVVDSLIDLCDGDSILLNANSSSPVIWNGGLSNGIKVSPSQNTNYIATTINSFGCSATDSTIVEVNANPTLSIPSSLSLCLGDSLTLNGISNGNVNWNVGVGNNVRIKPQNSISYYATAINSNGCQTIDSLDVSVLPLPSLNINNIASICEGQSAVLYANTNSSLDWNVGTGNNIQVYPNVTTEYFVTATDTNGCKRKDSIEVVVHPNPILAIVNTPSICIGDSINLNAVSNGNIIWNMGSSNPVMVSPLTTTNYTVTATSVHGCTTEDSTDVVVHSKPTLTLNAATSICDGDSINIWAISSGNVQWNIGGGNSQVVYPSHNTTYSATAINASGCKTIDSVLVSVFPSPILNIVPVNPICEGESTVLEANTNGQLQWNVGTGNHLIVSPQVNTNYVVTTTNANGCQKMDSIEVIVWPNPTLTVSSNDTICEGDTVTINANSNGQLSWGSGVSSLIVTPSSTTTYFVTATNIYNCLAEDSIEIIVYATPTMNVNNVAPICLGQSVVLHANATSSTAVSWNTGAGNTIVVTPSNSGVYKATATNNNGCETSDSVLVTVHPLPTLNVNNITSVCYGDTVTLSAISNGNVTWNLGQGNPLQVPMNTSSLCIATAINNYGCVKKDSMNISVLPELDLTLKSSKTVICKGDSVLLSSTGNGQVTWSHGQTGSISISPMVTQTYSAVIQNSLGCADSSEITIEVNNLPDISISGDTTICKGEGVALNATATGIIKWNQIIPNGRVVRPQTTTVYKASVIDTNHCENSKLKTVTVNPLPSVSIEPFSQSSICINNFNGIQIPQALPSGGVYSGNGIQNGYFYPQMAGIGAHTVSYNVVDGNGCKNMSSTTISVEICTDVMDTRLEETVKVFPNPVNAQLNIDLQWSDSENIKYTVLDVSGKVILQGDLQDMKVQTISTRNLSGGIYFLKIENSQKIRLIKFIKN